MNAKLRLLTVLSLIALTSACDRNDAPKALTPMSSVPEANLSRKTAPEPESATGVVPVIAAFDINAIPVTDKDIGEFPFFAPPKGYRYVTEKLSTLDESLSLTESARSIYPVGNDRLYMVEGKTLKTTLYNEKLKDTSERDFLSIQRYYENAITAAGGVKVFDEIVKYDEAYGMLAPEEDRHKLVPPRSARQIYVIRTQNTEAWFDINCGGGTGCLFSVTQKEKM